MDVLKKYIESDLYLVPIPVGQKGPRTKGWNLRDSCISKADQAHRLKGKNVGLAHLYSGTYAIDFDHLEKARVLLSQHNIDLDSLLNDPCNVQITSGRKNRGKLLFRLPEGVDSLQTSKITDSGETVLELRCADKSGEKTVQDVLPPSLHPNTGKPYRWRGDFTKLPTLPDELLKFWRVQIEPKKPPLTASSQSASSVDISRIQDALSSLDPDSGYDQWLRVGMALRSTDLPGAFDLWNEWSSKGNKYKPEEMDAKWESFQKLENGITIATLFHMAKQAGWNGGSVVSFNVINGSIEAADKLSLEETKNALQELSRTRAC